MFCKFFVFKCFECIIYVVGWFYKSYVSSKRCVYNMEVKSWSFMCVGVGIFRLLNIWVDSNNKLLWWVGEVGY